MFSDIGCFCQEEKRTPCSPTDSTLVIAKETLFLEYHYKMSSFNEIRRDSSSYRIENSINFRRKLSQNLQNLIPRPDLKQFPFLACDKLSFSRQQLVSAFAGAAEVCTHL
jgi:hypothetical protein